MYRICIVLYNCAARFSSHFGKDLDPLTYGLYAFTVSNVKGKSPDITSSKCLLVDSFVHLEEMGLVWLTQRTALDAIDTASKIDSGVASPKASINRPMSREAGADDFSPSPRLLDGYDEPRAISCKSEISVSHCFFASCW